MSKEDQRPRWRILWKYAIGLAPFVIVWLLLVGWLAGILYTRANWSEEADEATIREWLDETRPFRKSLPELIREYVYLVDEVRAGGVPLERLTEKRAELEEQMRVLVEPTRAYINQLPGFPVIYGLTIDINPVNGSEATNDKVVWENTLPRPRQQNQTRVRVLEYKPLGDEPRVVLRCEYQMHAFNKLQHRELERRRESLIAGVVLAAATLVAALFVGRFLARELRRETLQLKTQAAAEHRERELLETKLEAAGLEARAADAEKTALEMKSQLFASIGIMAGSYAHNIKNLLVRPNDLLGRCLETQGVSTEQSAMLQEVRSTLGMVTERLQQILQTVRRDPAKADVTTVDLTQLVRETAHAWTDMARDKWKLNLHSQLPTDGPVLVRGDLSHLQQAVENLLFNARDATFEMRNYLREQARKADGSDQSIRKQKLLDAAAWKGEVYVVLRRDDAGIVFEVRDNGIGMTNDVRQNCLRTHFTTKRDNALFEGHTAGMGLGLSFVAMVLERHHATLEIESSPFHGATFRIHFPNAEDSTKL